MRPMGARVVGHAPMFVFLALALLVLVITECTPGQRGVANSVLDLAEKVCHETDTVPVCLSKCELEQAHRDAERDAGTDR